MFDRHLPLDSAWFWFAVDVGLKATLLLAVAAAATFVLYRASAALRHRVWALTFVALLVLPLATLCLPGWSWNIIPYDWQATVLTLQDDASPADDPMSEDPQLEVTVAQGPDRAVSSRAEPLAQPLDRTGRAVIQQPELSSPPMRDDGSRTVARSPLSKLTSAIQTHWLLCVWLAGAVVVLLPLAIGIVGNWIVKRHARRVVEPSWEEHLDDLSRCLDLRRAVALYIGRPQQMPMTFGSLRPCVILPAEASDWTFDRRRMVLLHELAHVKRCDVAWQLVARAACAVYWLHPLAWYGIRRMRLEREHACDDCALEAGQKASSYATELLDIARAHQSCSPLAVAALSMARRSQLEGRLLAVLDAHRSRLPVTAARAGALLVASLSLVLVLGSLRPAVQADTSTPTVVAKTSGTANDPNAPVTMTGTVFTPQGKPVPGAKVEAFYFSWRTGRRRQEDAAIAFRTTADAKGRFAFEVPKHLAESEKQLSIYTSAPGFVLSQGSNRSDSNTTPRDWQVTLNQPKTIKIRLIDAAGNPVVGVTPQISNCQLEEDRSLWRLPEWANESIAAWPQCTPTDKDGYATVELPATTKTISVKIDDERAGRHIVKYQPLEDDALAIVLKPARFLSGKVVAADTGAPIAGSEIVLMEEPYQYVPIGKDGSFRLAHGTTIDTMFRDGESMLHVYPPADSPYLFYAQEWTWPDGDQPESTATFKLERGIVVEGQVVEKGSGRPVSGADVYFEPQQYGNKHFRESFRSRMWGSDMKYHTDANGHFRMPVTPGPGYLLVRAPAFDYVHVMVSMGDKYYGKPGLERQYHDGALHIELQPDEIPKPLTIELQRGVTLSRRVLQPNGQPAAGKVYARSYLGERDDISSFIPGIAIDQGQFMLPGFEPEHSNPLYILDLEHHCAAMVSAAASEIDLQSPAIQLQPCGAAMLHIVDEQKKPRAEYAPYLLLIVTPGAPATHFIQPDQPLWNDHMIWGNVDRRKDYPKSDANGFVTIPNLIPGATYRVQFVNKQGGWDDGYEFTVRPGETTDVGDVVIPEHD